MHDLLIIINILHELHELKVFVTLIHDISDMFVQFMLTVDA